MYCVDNYLRNIFGVNAVYWIAHILFGGYNERKGEHAGGGDAVVESEDPAINMNMRDVQESTQFSKYLQHDDLFSSSASSTNYEAPVFTECLDFWISILQSSCIPNKNINLLPL